MAKMMIVQILFFTLFVILSAAIPIQQVSLFFYVGVHLKD